LTSLHFKQEILLPTSQVVKYFSLKEDKSILNIVFSAYNDLIRTHLMILSAQKHYRTKVEKLFSPHLNRIKLLNTFALEMGKGEFNFHYPSYTTNITFTVQLLFIKPLKWEDCYL